MQDFFHRIIPPSPKKQIKEPSSDDSFFTNVKKMSHKKSDNSITPKLSDNGTYDIMLLHSKVLNHLKLTNSAVKDNTEAIKIQKWISENDPDPTERRIASERLFDLMNTSPNHNLTEDYLAKSKEILDRYRKLCEDPIVIDFVKREKTVKLMVKESLKRTAEEFIVMCQEYAPISLTLRLTSSTMCCDDPRVTCENGSFYCESCGETTTSHDQSGAYKDQKRVSTNSRQKYHNVKYFGTVVKKVQGIHKKEIPEYVFDELDQYRERHKKSVEQFTIIDLNTVLTMNKELSKFYKDIHLIYRLYTGIQLINLSDVESKLMDLYCLQDALAKTIKLKDDSKNSMNATYMCCRLAQFAGRTDLKISDFFCAKSKETIEAYDLIMEQRARKLGWLAEGVEFRSVCK